MNTEQNKQQLEARREEIKTQIEMEVQKGATSQDLQPKYTELGVINGELFRLNNPQLTARKYEN